MPDVVCIGSILWDVIGRPDPRVTRRMERGADLPGRIVKVPGGVALNVAVALRRFGLSPTLLGAVGRDPEGDALLESCLAVGLVTEHVTRTDGPTDQFVAIETADGVLGGIADARSLEAAGAAILEPLFDGRLERPWRGPVALDGNVTVAFLKRLREASLLAEADLRIVPASAGKAERLRSVLGHPTAVIYLNLEEANVVLDRRARTAPDAAVALVGAGAARAIVTDGPREAADATPRRTHLAMPHEVAVVRQLGAGDVFMAAHIAAEARGAAPTDAFSAAMDAAGAHVSGRP